MILVSKFMVHGALPGKIYLYLGLLSPLMACTFSFNRQELYDYVGYFNVYLMSSPARLNFTLILRLCSGFGELG